MSPRRMPWPPQCRTKNGISHARSTVRRNCASWRARSSSREMWNTSRKKFGGGGNSRHSFSKSSDLKYQGTDCGEAAAGDVDHAAGDIARVRRAEKGDEARELERVAQASHRNLRCHVRARL